MPVRPQRDDEVTRRGLHHWLSRALPETSGLRLGQVTVPRATGFSGETLIVDARWRTGRRRFVVRVAPTGFRLYPDDRLAQQFRVLSALDRTGVVPVPPVYGYESDPELLGAPFLVMGYVAGRVPPDFPSYHRQGWVGELAGPARAGLWWSALDALRRIHSFDPAGYGLDESLLGPSGVREQLDIDEQQSDFFGVAGQPVVREAYQWLRGHLPDEVTPVRLRWGDARLGNLIVDDGRVAAVIDWEMTGLGRPEQDIAWFLYLDRFLSAGIGAARLPYLPGRRRTIAATERGLGRPLRDLPFYEVLAGVRFAAITARLTRLMVEHGLAGADFPLHRNAVRQLADTLRACAD